MSDTSTNLQLPYMAAAQAQKHVTYNTALLRLDALVQGSALSRMVTAQPSAPTDGDVYILPAGKTGAYWGAMAAGALAYYRDGVWEQIAPKEGWSIYLRDEDQHVVYSGAAWGPILSAAQTAGFRNRLLNAAFAINQRLAASNADDTYGFDRWIVLTQSGPVACSSLVDPEAGRPTGLRMTQSQVSAQRFGVSQIIESANIRDLRGVAAAMAARLRCSIASVIRMAILEWTGAADAVTSDIVNSWTNSSYTPGNFFIAAVNVIATGSTTLASGVWTDMTQISGAFGSTLNNAIVFVWTEGAVAQNVTLDLDQIQLEPGGACGAFARRPFGEELVLCERYFEKSFPLGAAPAQNAGFTGCALFPQYVGASASMDGVAISYRVRKRATPSVTLYNPAAANALARNPWVSADFTGVSISSAGADAALLLSAMTTPAGSAAGQCGAIHWSADAEL